MKESPIFVKSFDFLAWLLARTEHFPKSQRFYLAKRLNDAMFDLYERLGEAGLGKGAREVERLQQADVYLLRLKQYVRLAMTMKCFSFRQYEYASRELQEIGRLLGAWLKQARSRQRGRNDMAAVRQSQQEQP